MAGGGDDDDMSGNAWPGFVDILSATVIMFVFFVMITAILMSVMSMDYREKIKSAAESEITEEMQEFVDRIVSGELSVEEVQQSLGNRAKIDALVRENIDKDKKIREMAAAKQLIQKELIEKTAQIEQRATDLIHTEEQDYVVSEDGKAVYVTYNRNSVTLTEETITSLKEFLRTHQKRTGQDNLRVSVLAAENPNAPTITVTRKVALSRALTVRNVFLANGVTSNNISIKYAKPREVESTYDWVQIKIED
ncbi:MAG: hypothetical protein VX740_00470 [Pseudomonadota bacterium]|jgi:hypothetical protein|nr:hypothetical protein [Alphaproteobacteria bacterium]MCS5596002.1 hypothetical protein [Alphaproteobacteria bacterium]MEC9234668.1 hypothetical protein [Pseudomonadota bacterium]MED5421891.1 hypothetical protein [Pseudomonadota bacterium]|tara:strand:+ start:582 stop:1334 length:753 start_codon:yes stop_codon:yes gene_type:complete